MHDFEPLVPGAGAAHVFAAGMEGFPAPMQAIKCPRCQSENTKFCYYNNYSLRQPRHYCKSCRRYWTRGGVLRNVPLGGGSHKKSSSKRPSKPATPPSEKNRCAAIAAGSELVVSSSESSGLTIAEESRLRTNPMNPIPSSDLQDALAIETIARGKGISSESRSFESLIGVGVADMDPPRAAEHQQLPVYAPPQQQPAPLFEARVEGGGYWEAAMDPTVFDLGVAGGGDGAVYWSHGQWGDTDLSRYLP